MVDIAYPIETRTLANGLRVVVSPDHTVPMVTVNLWVDVGSRHEVPGRTGFAHLFEHMMFNGAKRYGPGEFDKVLESNGGSSKRTSRCASVLKTRRVCAHICRRARNVRSTTSGACSCRTFRRSNVWALRSGS